MASLGRKHRKLLKDGSGTEVWPEEIEAIFFDGLMEYSHSPWAGSTRGRSRWRNQFMVDFLTKAGVARTKKQVASHMQVLRNAWKGTPEYRWVSGGSEDDDSVEPEASYKVKLEDDSNTKTLLDSHDARSTASQSTPALSPDRSSPVDCSPTPFGLQFPRESYSPILTSADPLYTITPMHSTTSYVRKSSVDAPHTSNWEKSAVIYPLPEKMPNEESPSITSTSTSLAPSLVSLSVQAEGMATFTIQVVSATANPPTLYIKLFLPAADDFMSSEYLQGFTAKIALSGPWSYFATCTTRVHATDPQVASESTVPLLPEWLNHDIFLPGSAMTVVLPFLSDCRHLPNFVRQVSQAIVVDGATVANICYSLDRVSGGMYPSAALLRADHCRASLIQIPPPVFNYRNLAYNTRSTSSYTSSLSGALTPV